jgi:hypothetical protein
LLLYRLLPETKDREIYDIVNQLQNNIAGGAKIYQIKEEIVRQSDGFYENSTTIDDLRL